MTDDTSETARRIRLKSAESRDARGRRLARGEPDAEEMSALLAAVKAALELPWRGEEKTGALLRGEWLRGEWLPGSTVGLVLAKKRGR